MTPRLRSVGVGALVAAVVFALGYCFDLLALRDPNWVVADAFALGAIIGLIVFAYEHRRARSMAERIRIIRDMNRYIRNELQVIVSATPEHGARAVAIGHCVDHIDWALRELLPGKTHLSESSAPQHITELDRSA
jgi:hypothetical protein